MRDIIQDILGNICLFAAAWIIAYRMPKRKMFWVRTVLCFAVFCVLRHLYFDSIVPLIEGDDWSISNMLGFTVLLGLTTASVAIAFDCGFWPALFCGSTSYCLQHICQRTYLLLSRLWLNDAPEILYVLLFVGIMAVCLAALCLFIRKFHIDRIVVDNKYLLMVSLVIIASAMVLDLVMFRAMHEGGNLLRYCIYISSILISSLVFVLQFSMVSRKKKELELDAIKAMLDEERSQYYFEKSMIEMVNIKCHDLKHQIAALDQADRKKLRDDIKPVVDAYDSSFRTGNVALDVVLTREKFNCKEKGITLTCVANGKCLEFMSEVDVYSLFGNILDNAIEATEKLEDKEKRVISLTVAQDGYFINIHAENYYCDTLTFSDGLPETTKKDTVYHGFGLKSIRMLVHKYDGSMKLTTNEDRFVLDIMFSV